MVTPGACLSPAWTAREVYARQEQNTDAENAVAD
jgi:hypothetical protein